MRKAFDGRAVVRSVDGVLDRGFGPALVAIIVDLMLLGALSGGLKTDSVRAGDLEGIFSFTDIIGLAYSRRSEESIRPSQVPVSCTLYRLLDSGSKGSAPSTGDRGNSTFTATQYRQ